MAGLAIRANRNIARMRATLDLVERAESQQYYQDLSENFRNIRQKFLFDDLTNAPKEDEEKQKLISKLYFFLNHYELIAVAFKMKVLDKDFYSLFMRDTVVRDWQASKGFIRAARNDPDEPRPGLYVEFEEVAQEWQAEIDLEELSVPRRRPSIYGCVRRHIDALPNITRRRKISRFVVIYAIVAFRRARRWHP
jgi:hypothetical protein